MRKGRHRLDLFEDGLSAVWLSDLRLQPISLSVPLQLEQGEGGPHSTQLPSHIPGNASSTLGLPWSLASLPESEVAGNPNLKETVNTIPPSPLC